uniref:ATP-dependent RNA helicase n=1 Tax=Lygus hesperus TaxID=30085 RepID=A0A0A9X7W5_LYGHE
MDGGDTSKRSVLQVRTVGTQALILTPTRELALQTQHVCDTVVQKSYFWLLYTTLIGGEKQKSEKARLRKGIHIVIGTPGRVMYHIVNTVAWNLRHLRWFVLDEADRLLNLGFSNTIQTIYENLDPLQTKNRMETVCRCVFVSATIGGSGDGNYDRGDFSCMKNFVTNISKNIELVGFTEQERR